MSGPSLVVLYVVLAVVLLSALAALALRRLSARGQSAQGGSSSFDHGGPHPGADRVWVVVNPTKPSDFASFQSKIDTLSEQITGRAAVWLETTVEDPGTGQAVEALQHSPSVVIAAGGDGTVRAVAAGMSHSKVPMGIIPVGTGNLVARNLRLPLSLSEAFEVAVTGRPAAMDLAWLHAQRVDVESELPTEGSLLLRALHRSGERRETLARVRDQVPDPLPNEYSYLVISGVGFDGETMANTSPKLKKAVGWSAYVFTALKSLRSERMKATITLYSPQGSPSRKPRWARAVPAKVYRAIEDSHTIGANLPHMPASSDSEDWFTTALQARTVLMANCGTLPFTVLAPYAEIDDGALDVIAIDTQAGLLGWANLAAKVLGQGAGLRPINTRRDLGQISFQQCRSVRIDTNRPYPIQVDGDHVGSARTIVSRIDEGALIVRHPWVDK